MNTGGLQRSPERQLITPLPYSPPKMKAAFFRSGTTATQRAFDQYSCGMSTLMSWTTCAAAASRAASDAPIAARALPVAASTRARTQIDFPMIHLVRSRVVQCNCHPPSLDGNILPSFQLRVAVSGASAGQVGEAGSAFARRQHSPELPPSRRGLRRFGGTGRRD